MNVTYLHLSYIQNSYSREVTSITIENEFTRKKDTFKDLRHKVLKYGFQKDIGLHIIRLSEAGHIEGRYSENH